MDRTSGRHREGVVTQLQRQGFVAGPPGRAIDGVALAEAIVAPGFDEHLPIQPNLIEGIAHQAIPVSVVHGEQHAGLPVSGRQAKREQGVVSVLDVDVQQNVAGSVGQGPGHLLRPGIGLDDDGEGVLLAGTVLRGQRTQRQEKQGQEQGAHGVRSRCRWCMANAKRPWRVAHNLQPVPFSKDLIRVLFSPQQIPAPWPATTTTTITPKRNRTNWRPRGLALFLFGIVITVIYFLS